MRIDPTIFKAYDVRGLYGDQIDGDVAEQVGRAFVRVIGKLSGKAKGELRLGLGRDMRLSAPELAARYRRAALFVYPSLANRGESFGLADCAAAPALFYANKVMPVEDHHPHLARYLDRLTQRPSYARVLAEAQPYFALFPG